MAWLRVWAWRPLELVRAWKKNKKRRESQRTRLRRWKSLEAIEEEGGGGF